MTNSENPVLATDFRIPFRRIRGEHVEEGIPLVLDEARRRVEALAVHEGPPTWESVVEELDDLCERVRRATAPVEHLMSVAETPALRKAYNAVLPEISEFWSWLQLHEGLWETIREYAETDGALDLDPIRDRHLRKTIREFRRAGADLPPEPKARLGALRVELARLQQKFGENVLDATAAYELHLEEESRLEGVPDHAVRRFRNSAEEKDLDGWIVTLDFPSYEAVVKHAADRSLREELHRAYTGRCRDGEWNNREIIARILSIRQEMAEVLGYEHFPDLRLEEAMAGSGAEARAFVDDLVERTRPYFRRDWAELESHAGELGIDRVEPWDVTYIQEHLRRARYEIDDESLRPYFPMDRVLDGLFQVVERVFGIRVEETEGWEEAWHPDVRSFRAWTVEGEELGEFLADFYPRKEKRQGAWMNYFITGVPDGDGGWTPHLGFIAANVSPPGEDGPALLTHREVQTLFHEFGHLLHHLCSRVPIRARAGLNVAWDWVEVPSQIMENWTWEDDAVRLFARHVETDEPLPVPVLRRLQAARRFMGGWAQMRQLGFGSLDLALHLDFATGEDGEDVMSFAMERLEPFAPRPEFVRRNNLTVFSHLFSGGYASAYYSYLWSEVLEADAFRRFEERGIFDRDTGRAYVRSILSRGDSAEPAELFREFMGREPDPQALIDRNLGELDG